MFSFQLLLMRNFSVAPHLRCCVKTTGVIHKIDAAPAQLSPHKLIVMSLYTALTEHFLMSQIYTGTGQKEIPQEM